MNYTEMNAKSVDKWNAAGWVWGKTISHEAYEQAKNGSWYVHLSPTKPVPETWFPNLQGLKILGLASGGGQQMPIFSALGANCTVMDYSESQLEREKEVSEREGYAIDIVRADMSKPLPFADSSFDLIFHPVSNCYIEKVLPVWQECSRILKPGGRLLAGLDNGINYLFDDDEREVVRGLPFNPLKDQALFDRSVREDWGIQFSHTLEEQIGGQLKAGFQLKDLYEDTNGEGRLHELHVPTFWCTLAVKPE